MTHLRASQATPRQAIIYSIPILLIGCVIAVIGGRYGFQSYIDYLQAQKTAGRVIRLDLINSVYKPVVEFSDSGGHTYQFTDSQGSKPAAYQVGNTVEVLYPSNHPEQAKINSLLETWISPLLPLLCSAFWLITGGLFLQNGIRRLRKSTS